MLLRGDETLLRGGGECGRSRRNVSPSLKPGPKFLLYVLSGKAWVLIASSETLKLISTFLTQKFSYFHYSFTDLVVYKVNFTLYFNYLYQSYIIYSSSCIHRHRFILYIKLIFEHV